METSTNACDSPWIGLPEDTSKYIGFVYVIVHKTTGYWYCGKKLFTKAIRRDPLKGKKKVRLARIKSDYEKYWGSSKMFLEYVKEHGKDAFERKIVSCHPTKYTLALAELKYQINWALNAQNCFNEIINVRLRAPKPFLNEMRKRMKTAGLPIAQNTASNEVLR